MTLMTLFTACSNSTPLTRQEVITATLLQLDDMAVDWFQSSDVSISAKPACAGEAYWRTFHPADSPGRFHLVQQVIFDCSDATGGQYAFWVMTRPMSRITRPAQPIVSQWPLHADDFAAYCEFNPIGTTECRTVVRYGNLVSEILSVRGTGMQEWPDEQDLLDWCQARNDLMLSKLARKD